jgi:hypothetical protein
MTDPADFERRTEQLRLDLARRDVRGMYEEAAARTQRLLFHPPDRATPTCGHPDDPQFVDYLTVEDLRVVCLPCLLDRMAQPGHRCFDLGIHTCSSCGDDELVAFISAVVHVEGWDSVEHLLTAPLGFACPACDGFEGKLPPIMIKRWAA